MFVTSENFQTAGPVISLVPSLTELLFELIPEERIVGVTRFCIHPNRPDNRLPRVGGTKNVDFDRVKALNPSLIIANKEENSEADILLLAEHFPVYLSEIYTVPEAIASIREIGTLINAEEKAFTLAREIVETWKLVRNSKSGRVVYLIWNEPRMSVGKATYIGNVLEWLGYELPQLEDDRYPVISDELLLQLNPDVLMLSSEPFPFKASHVEAYRQLLPNSEVKIVDGEIYSWYGNRMLKINQLV